jgi:uncharacterized protein YecE (DUF72 family)
LFLSPRANGKERNYFLFAGLGPKLGPIVFQFPFFSRSTFPDRHAFTDRLIPFLRKLLAGRKFAIEIRNRDWLNAELANLLRDRRIALVLQDRSWLIQSKTDSTVQLGFNLLELDWRLRRVPSKER